MSSNVVMQLPPTKAKTQPKETFSSSPPPASPKQQLPHKIKPVQKFKKSPPDRLFQTGENTRAHFLSLSAKILVYSKPKTVCCQGTTNPQQQQQQQRTSAHFVLQMFCYLLQTLYFNKIFEHHHHHRHFIKSLSIMILVIIIVITIFASIFPSLPTFFSSKVCWLTYYKNSSFS